MDDAILPDLVARQVNEGHESDVSWDDPTARAPQAAVLSGQKVAQYPCGRADDGGAVGRKGWGRGAGVAEEDCWIRAIIIEIS